MHKSTFLDTHATRSKRSATYESMLDTDNVASKRLVTWAGDKNPNDFMDWSVDSEGNFFIDIPLKSKELQFSNDNHDINKVILILKHRNAADHTILRYLSIRVIGHLLSN